MLYIISFYTDECEKHEGDFLLEDYPEICEGHLRIGDLTIGYTSTICEIYQVFDEEEFLKLTSITKMSVPHLETFKKIF